MKFQKLIIHNIASIEDATIDFSAEPLSDSGIFIIAGKTGSGKSTILDCICLALYGTTPRLKATKIQGNTRDGKNNIGVDDVRQLMRRNTAECFVSLTFIGNNGKHYQADWAVRRARNAVNGNLQPRERCLKNIDDNFSFERDNDIKAEIASVIGLDFEQFLRTVMLSQGEFTKFLNSSDNDKADILEKLTGIDIYSKIGKKIYDKTKEKKLEKERLFDVLEKLPQVNDEEIESCKKQLEENENALKVKQEALTIERNKKDWIEKDNSLLKTLEDIKKEKDNLDNISVSDSYKKIEKCAKEWRNTQTIRTKISQREGNVKQLQSLDTSLLNLKQIYIRLLSGKNYLHQTQHQANEDLKQIEQWLEREKCFEGLYDNSQTIIGNIDSILKYRVEITSLKEKENQLSLQKEDKEKELEKQNKLIEESQNLILEKEKELNALNLTEKRNRQVLLTELSLSIDNLKKIREERKRIEANLKQIKESIESKTKDLEERITPDFNKKKADLENCKAQYEKQKDTVDKFAITIRQSLNEGDICPICRQKVISQLPNEDALNELVKTLKENYEKAEQEYKTIEAEKNKIEGELKLKQEAYARDKQAFDNDNTLEEVGNDFKDKCERTGITNLEISKEDVDNEREIIANDISKGEELEKGLNDLKKELNDLKNKFDELKNHFNELKNKLGVCENTINTRNLDIDTASKKVNEIIGVNALLKNQEGETLQWQDNSKEYRDILSVKTEEYRDYQSKYQNAQTNLERLANECTQVQGLFDSILERQADWRNLKSGSVECVQNLYSQSSDLKDSLLAKLTQKKDLLKSQEEIAASLEEYLKENPQYDENLLVNLNSIDESNIEGYEKQLKEHNNNVTKANANLQTAQRNYDDNLTHKPEIKEEETLESIGQNVSNLEQEIETLGKSIGAFEERLKGYENDKENRGKLFVEYQEKEAEYNKWNRLNNIFGSADGATFRKIAQSYVLENLINSANHHLKVLTDRYRLTVEPGGFVIEVEDAYQGFVSRPVTTISGGESFIISLSLALALSDMGQGLSLDILFIDEGFGSLSKDVLQTAIDTLSLLHGKVGKRVGIISHVEELQEKIPVQIQVNKEGNSSSSTVKVVNGTNSF